MNHMPWWASLEGTLLFAMQNILKIKFGFMPGIGVCKIYDRFDTGALVIHCPQSAYLWKETCPGCYLFQNRLSGTPTEALEVGWQIALQANLLTNIVGIAVKTPRLASAARRDSRSVSQNRRELSEIWQNYRFPTGK